jgi:hypothetical protein
VDNYVPRCLRIICRLQKNGVPTASVNNRTSGAIPVRLSYPQIEINVNGPQLSAGPGIPQPYISLSNKVWWILTDNFYYLLKPSVNADGFFYIFAPWKRTSNILN